ncbi:MAG TPA: hypothetical protein VGV69_00105, partial [Solirubrobacterales bacterium]|nr:hypothetical protein [Solirubrobacterales bacterium]
MSSVSLPDEVRAACAWVAERSRLVSIDEERIDDYAAGLTQTAEPAAATESSSSADRDPEAATAFAICMNAINFGSGWWPTIRKRPGLSGYGTMEAGIGERFASAGPWSAEELAAMDAGTIASTLGQDPEHPLMAQFAVSFGDIGMHVRDDHGGRFLGVVEEAESVPALAAALAGWCSFADSSHYEGREVPF